MWKKISSLYNRYNSYIDSNSVKVSQCQLFSSFSLLFLYIFNFHFDRKIRQIIIIMCKSKPTKSKSTEETQKLSKSYQQNAFRWRLKNLTMLNILNLCSGFLTYIRFHEKYGFLDNRMYLNVTAAWSVARDTNQSKNCFYKI